MGYHRLYSHRAFRAALPVRMFLALLGASAFQGSIKVRSVPPVAHLGRYSSLSFT